MTSSKTLIVVRHAKSSWEDTSLPDHDRTLNRRGERDAPRMAKRLFARGPIPERIISSSAARALATAEAFVEGLGVDRDALEVEPRIYGAGYQAMIGLLRGLDDGYDCVMVVGHNPTFTELANALTPEAVGHLPTCSVVTLALDGPRWRGVGEETLRLLDFDFPKKGRSPG